MDNALGIIDNNAKLPAKKHFSWTVSGWPLSAQILGPLQTPERKVRIEKAIREGAIVAHAFPFTTHTESLDYEDLVRGLGFSSDIARKYGIPMPISAKMTDVPRHSWVLPTLLSHAGIEFLQLGKWLKSYDEKRQYIRNTENIILSELTTHLNLLAESVTIEGKRMFVYNPLPWTRSGLVEIP